MAHNNLTHDVFPFVFTPFLIRQQKKKLTNIVDISFIMMTIKDETSVWQIFVQQAYLIDCHTGLSPLKPSWLSAICHYLKHNTTHLWIDKMHLVHRFLSHLLRRTRHCVEGKAQYWCGLYPFQLRWRLGTWRHMCSKKSHDMQEFDSENKECDDMRRTQQRKCVDDVCQGRYTCNKIDAGYAEVNYKM